MNDELDIIMAKAAPNIAAPASTELARVAPPKPPVRVGPNGYIVDDIDGAWRLARIYLQGGMVPDSTIQGMSAEAAVARVVALIEVAQSLGIPARAAFKGITSVRGNLLIWGDLTVALCQRHRDWRGMEFAYSGELSKGDRAATVTVHRNGCPSVSHTFSQADAKRAGLGGKVWESYTDRMLFNRARSWALRDQFADALNGIGIGEEQFLSREQFEASDGEASGTTFIDANAALQTLQTHAIQSLT
jgi:hypothetical protein